MAKCPFEFPHATYMPVTHYPEVLAIIENNDSTERGLDGERFVVHFFGCWFHDMILCREQYLTTDCYSRQFSMRIEVKVHQDREPSTTKIHDRDQFNRNISHNSYDVYNMVFVDICPNSTLQTQSRHSDGIMITYINAADLTVDFMHKFFRDVKAHNTIRKRETREANLVYRNIANNLSRIDRIVIPNVAGTNVAQQNNPLPKPHLRGSVLKKPVVLPPLKPTMFEPISNIIDVLCGFTKPKLVIEANFDIDIPLTDNGCSEEQCNMIHNVIDESLQLLDEEHGRGRRTTVDWETFAAYACPNNEFWNERARAFQNYTAFMNELRQKYRILERSDAEINVDADGALHEGAVETDSVETEQSQRIYVPPYRPRGGYYRNYRRGRGRRGG